MLLLSGIAIVILGFALRLNPLAVVAVGGLATGIAGGSSPTVVLETFGRAFAENRYVGIVWLVLPVVGLLERAGVREHVQALMSAMRAVTTARVLLLYLLLRQISAEHGPIGEAARMEIRAYAAATDNIGLFFGEDVFIAVGSILLMKGFLQQSGFVVAPFALARWAIPTAILAFLIHGARLLLLDRRLRHARAQVR